MPCAQIHQGSASRPFLVCSLEIAADAAYLQCAQKALASAPMACAVHVRHQHGTMDPMPNASSAQRHRSHMMANLILWVVVQFHLQQQQEVTPAFLSSASSQLNRAH